MKKELVSHFHCLLALVFITHSTNAQWTELNGPTDFISSFVEIDGTLFAATLIDGLYRSDNGGERWTVAIGTDDLYNYVQSLAVVDNTLFCVTSDAIFRSEDKGNTWIAAGSDFTFISSLAVIDTSVFSGTRSGVFHSTDRGINWVKIGAAFSDTNIFSLNAVKLRYADILHPARYAAGFGKGFQSFGTGSGITCKWGAEIGFTYPLLGYALCNSGLLSDTNEF